MQIIIELFVIFIARTILDTANIFLLYDKFLTVKKVKPSKYIWVNMSVMFGITLWFWSINAEIVNYKWMMLFCFPLYYTRVIWIIWSFFEKRLKDLAMIFFYESFVATISEQIRIFTKNPDDSTVISGYRTEILELLIAALIFIMIMVAYYLRKNNMLKIYFGDLNFTQYILFGLTLFLASLLQVGILKYNNTLIVKGLTLTVVFLISLMIGQTIFIKEADVRKGRIINILDEQMDKVTGYYNEVIEIETQTKKFRHDIKNLLIALRSLVEAGDNEKALEYIDTMNTMCKKSASKFDTGNFIADTMLMAKQAVAEDIDTQIEFSGFIPNSIENVDLVILLSNILDNAIEACEKMDGKKTITVDSVLNKRMWVLSVYNPTINKVKINKNKIETTKDDKEIHGFGIQNMERVVDRYNGSLNFECKDNVFCVKAMLQINN